MSERNGKKKGAPTGQASTPNAKNFKHIIQHTG